jgi:hypothetical protein
MTLDFLDPTTSFHYEGALEIDGTFLSPDGNSVVSSGTWNSVWIGPSGTQTLTVGKGLPYGTYTVRFRPHPFSSPDSALQTNAETVSANNSLPWSNQFTVNIVNLLPGDLNGDNHVDIFDYNLLVTHFGNPYTIFDYNVLVGNFGK